MQRTICIMLHRSQKPMMLTAMGYVTMNFETFCSVINLQYAYYNIFFILKFYVEQVLGTSWSWFTLLQTIYEP